MAEKQEVMQLLRIPPEPLIKKCSSRTYRSAEHSQTLLSGLRVLRDRSILFDVVLHVEGKPIEAHRILLAASCDYFRGMFAGGLREMEQEEIHIQGISYNAMCKILNFIYTSELELGLGNVQEILAASCQLQISEIIKFCCDFLTLWVDDENIVDMYKLADLFDLGYLTEKLDSYFLKNFVLFSKTEMYRQLPLEKVCALLNSNVLEVNSENEVYEGALLYHYAPEQVETDQVLLLETVRFPLMDLQTLQRLHNKLSLCPLKEAVASALTYHEKEGLQPLLQNRHTQVRSEFHCVVAFGGMHSTPSTFLSNQARYDPRHNKWLQIQSLQQEHTDLCVCVVGGNIYAVAGRNYREDLREVEKYDPKTNSWEYVAPLQKEVYAHAGAELGGKIYVACGRRGEEYLKELHCYDPEADRWDALPDSPTRRAWHGMAALLGRLYVIGGSNNDSGSRRDVHQVACYSPSASQWTTVRPLHAGHGEPGIAVLGHKIYVLGGRSHNRGICMDCVHVYDAEADCWEEGPQLDDDVSGMAACVLTLPRALFTEGDRCESGWQHHGLQDYPDEVLNTLDWEEFANLNDN